jgi:Carboxypeptidase regulatory-like domain/TonB-dependent Receptor Plug Domain
MFKRLAKRVNPLVILFIALFFGNQAFSQTTSGSITGIVKDINGAAVPGAVVVLVDPAQNAPQEVTTNEEGIFIFPQVKPGTYTVTVEKAGFKKIQKNTIVLSTGDRLNAGDFTLEIGEVSNTVTVTADAAQLQIKTESGERSDIVTGRQLQDLALNGRNVLDLTKTIPGIININQNATSTVNNAAGAFNINGARNNMNEVQIDGATNINTGNNTGLLVTVNPDSIAETKVLTSNYQAEYGRSGGGFVLQTTRSGTNDFHGSARYFRRHDSLNANSFFNNLRGNPRNIYRFNSGGYSIGGPVYFPRFGEGGPAFWRGKDKLFFFFSQEYYRQLVPEIARNVRVPTSSERNGDFSSLLPTTVIRDVNNCLGNGAGSPFPGNIIPRQCFYGNGQILAFYPQANVAGNSQFNYTSQLSSAYPRREDILRIDYLISDKTKLNGRFIRNQDEQIFSYGTTSAAFNFPLTSTSRANGPGYTLGFTLTHNFSPTLVNEFNYAPSKGGVTIATINDAGTRSVNGITVPLLFPNANNGNQIPNFSFDTNIAGTSAFQNQTFAETLFNGSPFKQTFLIHNLSDILTKVVGNHIIKGGLFWQNSHNNRTSFGPIQSNIEFNFSALDAGNPLNSGTAYANALLGTYAQYQQASVQLSNKFVYNNFEGFIQDTWKVNQRFSLDYGLRLSNFQPLYDKESQLSFFNSTLYSAANAPRIYQPTCINNVFPCVSGAAATNRRAIDSVTGTIQPASFIGLLVPNTGSATNGIGLSSADYPRGGFKSPKLLVAPRLGFAFDVFGNQKTVLRGGFGISYDRVRGDLTIDAITNPPNVFQPSVFYGRLNDISSLGGSGVRAIPSITTVDPGGDLPAIYSYSLSVQRNLGFSTVLDIGYVGTLGRHLGRQRNINAIPYLTTFQRSAQDPTRFAGGVVPTIEPGLPAAYSAAGFNFSGANSLPIDFLRPYKGYGDILLRSFDANSNYNSLQIGVTRRFKNNFTFGVAYTFSKTLTNASTDGEVTNSFNGKVFDYRVADFDRTHVLVINYVYNLPKLSKITGGNSLTRGILDNWQISGISQFVSGTPFDLSLTGLGAQGSRLVGTPTATGTTGSLSGQQPRFLLNGPLSYSYGTNGLVVDTSQFIVPGIGYTGSYPRNYVRNPGWNNHDVSVFKNFPFNKERTMYLQIRGEFFNIFNTTQFTAINAGSVTITPGSPTPVFNLRPSGSTAALGTFFGEYNATRDPRVIQLAAKFYF